MDAEYQLGPRGLLIRIPGRGGTVGTSLKERWGGTLGCHSSVKSTDILLSLFPIWGELDQSWLRLVFIRGYRGNRLCTPDVSMAEVPQEYGRE